MKSINELVDLSAKTAIVTGGAKGIGLGIVRRLSEAGATVVIADYDIDVARSAAEELSQQGRKVKDYEVDVAEEDQIKSLIDYCTEEFGSVDIVVNNAGIYPAKPIAEMTKAEFDRVVQVNLDSVFLMTKYASEVMKQQGSGKIINITSIDALHPSMVGLAHYDSSKHGVWGFTKNTALELAPFNITVNAIAPGGIQTPGVEAMQGAQKIPEGVDMAALSQAFLAKIPLHRMGDPDEIGTVALFLASGLSSYMTGEQIVVDGGALLS